MKEINPQIIETKELTPFDSQPDNLSLKVSNVGKKVANVYYSSIPVTTRKEKIDLVNMLNGENKSVKLILNKTIKLKNVYIDIIDCVDDKSGVVEKAPRCILVDDKGKSSFYPKIIQQIEC